MKQILTILLITFAFFCKAQITVDYTYDNLNRLTEANYNNGVVIKYTYDALGNRTQETYTNNTLSVENVEQAKDIILYPNPFVDELTIKAKNQLITAVYLYDLSGKLIRQEKVNHLTECRLNANQLVSGVYMAVVVTDKGKQSYKIIKK